MLTGVCDTPLHFLSLSIVFFSPQITQISADENNINISIRANPRESVFQKIIICVICGELF